MISLAIPGSPHGQGRPRAVRRGGFVSVYERPEDKEWKEYARQHYAIAMKGKLAFEGPVRVVIVAFWPQPASARKAERPFRKWRVGKPDCDNVAKAVLDAANGLVWNDDAQVAELRVYRIVGREGEAPRIEIVVDDAGALPQPLLQEENHLLGRRRSAGLSRGRSTAEAASAQAPADQAHQQRPPG